MFYYVYVLENKKNENLYIGYTTDIKRRLQEHNHGLNFSTKPFKPWKLIHLECYLNELDAKRREGYLKTSQGGRLLKRMLKRVFLREKKNLDPIFTAWEAIKIPGIFYEGKVYGKTTKDYKLAK